MKKLYSSIFFIIAIALAHNGFAQNCALLKATFKTYESRCAATGSIKINTTGGTGNYKYKVTGPVSTNFTTSDSITGLSAGSYTVEVVDITNNCTYTAYNVVVSGNYSDPRFTLSTVSVSCDNGINGQIKTEGLNNGRAPFTFTIVSPSPMGVGNTSSDGNFSGLSAGDYAIRLTDSCGGIQTRTVSIQNYTWRIDSYLFTKFSCDSAYGYIKVIDSRGNVSTITGIPGMQYGILTIGQDTVWSTDPNFRFNVYHIKSMQAFAKDSCGNIKKISASLFLAPSIDATVSVSDKVCNTFTASVTGLKNLFNPNFCIYNSNGDELDCNDTGVFPNLPYGNYCIKVYDDCYDTVITRCFTSVPLKPSVNKEVGISDKTCNTFTATVRGLKNFTDPTFCIYNNLDELLYCNTTGVFNDLPLGEYCIKTTDGCIDTTITKCFSVARFHPQVDSVIIPSYVNCETFGLNIGGDSLTAPVYCLYDTSHNQIACNTTGIFDSIPLGSYCITVYDACIDSTFERCFSVGMPVISNDMTVNLSDQTCSSFTARVQTSNLNGGSFCLYDVNDELIKCDSTGIFTGLAYGSYCVKANPGCPDTTVISCFIATPPVPSIGATPSISNRTCSTFTAKVNNLKNLTDPTFYLLNSSADTIGQNTSGQFANLLYGSYCIVVKNTCYDTTLTVCFTATPNPLKITASMSRSCTYGYSKGTLSVSTYPVNIQVFDPVGNVMYAVRLTASATFDLVPAIPEGQKYKVVVVDDCNNTDTLLVAPVISYLNHRGSVQQKCPGSVWPDGSGNITLTATTNTGALTVRIIKKDGMNYATPLVPNAVKDSLFTFNDLGPGTYVIRTNSNDGCNVYMFDTVVVKPYEFPNLKRSSAYQCDVNGFSVGAVATNGVGPFTFEIIGSTPDIPSIVAGPQASPVFNIDNGFNYSLIRLRALDACGNATLGDASILPMANNGIKVSENCFGADAVLSIDTVFNSMVSWYYKKNIEDTDSVLVATGFAHEISELTPQDTGYYICNLNVNNGCISRVYNFHVTGDCYPILPVLMVEFTGRMIENKSHLNWSIRNDQDLKSITIERFENGNYKSIGILKASEYNLPGQYSFVDEQPLDKNDYRLKIYFNDGSFKYSKIVHLNRFNVNSIRIYPNPAIDQVVIEFNNQGQHTHKIELINVLSQKTILNTEVNTNKYAIYRTQTMTTGMYILKVTDKHTGETQNFKVLFSNK